MDLKGSLIPQPRPGKYSDPSGLFTGIPDPAAIRKSPAKTIKSVKMAMFPAALQNQLYRTPHYVNFRNTIKVAILLRPVFVQSETII